jgi:hypothetical protein
MKNLLTIAVNKYGSSVFMPKLQQALGGAPAAKPTVAATGSYIVNFDRVNVRDAPDEVNGKVVTQLQAGIVVEVLEATAQSYKIGGNTAPWYRIMDPEGWVFGASLAPAPEGHPEEIDRGGDESPEY